MSESVPITLTVNQTSLTFNVSPEDQERLIDELKPDSKVAPMHNFLTRCVDNTCKEALKPFLSNPSAVIQIGERVVEAATPTLKITVGE